MVCLAVSLEDAKMSLNLLYPWESELFFKAYKNAMDTGGDLGAMLI